MSARADLCGGRSAMIVPTATFFTIRKNIFLSVEECNGLITELVVANRSAVYNSPASEPQETCHGNSDLNA